MPTTISKAEKDQYWEFVRSLLAELPPIKTAPILWHYTTGATLIRIIESASLWATQISCLNDERELRQSELAYAGAIEEYAREHGARFFPDERTFHDRLKTALLTNSAPNNWWFVTCFSAVRDDLSQWRAYSGGEGGYSIGFKTLELARLASTDDIYLAPVRYDSRLHREVAAKVAEATFTFFRQGLAARTGDLDGWITTFLTAWADVITYLGPIVKHETFAAEQEWRLVRRLRDDDRPQMRYLQRQMMMSRHLPLTRLSAPHVGGRSLLPIEQVIVGPSRHKDISRISVSDLLATNGYPMTPNLVDVSKVPFQTL